jgi:hypothetical protein
MAKEKILIVDDEPMIRWTLNEALRGWEYDTVEAGTVAGGGGGGEGGRPAGRRRGARRPSCSTSTYLTARDSTRCARSKNASRRQS